MVSVNIDVYTYGFTVRTDNSSLIGHLESFCSHLTQYETSWDPVRKRQKFVKKAVFAAIADDKQMFSFLKEDLGPLKRHLYNLGYSDNSIKEKIHKVQNGIKINLPLKKGVGPRDDEQKDVANFLSTDRAIRVVNLRTGGGKTATTLMEISRYGRRAGLVMSAGYFKTWIKDMKWVYKINFKRDLCTVNGQKDLAKLIELTKAGQNKYKIIMLSIDTVRTYLDNYLRNGITIDGILPIELFAFLGIGIRVVDESHENIHALINSTIHCDVSKTIYLSATLVSGDTKVQEQYSKIFPHADRFKGRNNDHVIALGYRYRIKDTSKLRYKGFKGYSHVKFEQSIRKCKRLRTSYYEMIAGVTKRAYINRRKKGQKLLIFCSTVEMCSELAGVLTSKYGNEGITVSDYNADHDESVLYSHDIVVSTPQSAGTGKDIANLSCCIATVAIGSIQRNLQMIGRPRPMKDFPDDDPLYIWLSCRNIPQHKNYDRMRMDQYRECTKSVSMHDTPYEL